MGGITFLPFVRDSKIAPGAKPPAAPVAVKAEAVAAASSDPLAAAIDAKGEEIRVLKANKVSSVLYCVWLSLI